MIRKFIASKKTIIFSFSHGGRKYYSSSVLGPKFPLSDGEKTRFNRQPWSERLDSDHLSQPKNQGNNFHENNLHESNSENSSDDEFSELGPSVISPTHKLDFSPLLKNPQIETEDSTERPPTADPTNDGKTPDFFKIRINKVSSEISEMAIHNICSSYGPVSSLARKTDGSIDVLFRVKNKSEAQTILNKLNNSTIDGTHISAQLLTCETTSNLSEGNFIDSRFDELFGSFWKKLDLQSIYLEDLVHLHRSIVHLKAHPNENNSKW